MEVRTYKRMILETTYKLFNIAAHNYEVYERSHEQFSSYKDIEDKMHVDFALGTINLICKYI